MSLTRSLAEHIVAFDAAQLTDRDLDGMRRLLLDHLAVVLAGSRTESAAVFQRFVHLTGQGSGMRWDGELPIMGTSHVAPAVQAAMANAVAAHSVELDDTHNASSTHPGAVIFPTALAAVGLARQDERALLRGVALGYEVMCRVGRAIDPAGHYQRNFHPTATTGRLGAAAAASSIFGLDVEQTTSALGIAATQTSGSLEFLEDGSWTKRLHPALAARDGLESARLAACGFQGTLDGLGGRRGFFSSTYSAHPHPERLLDDWGERELELHSSSIKPHACCRYSQAPIDALLTLRHMHALQPEQIGQVQVGLLSTAMDIVWEPVAHKRRPRTVVDAQFSLPYAAAVALLDGQVGLEQFAETRLTDPRVIRLMDRVECIGDARLDANYPQRWGGWARVRTTDGRLLDQHVADPRGDARNPLTDAELEAKLHELAGPVMASAQRAEVLRLVGELPATGVLPALLEALRVPAPLAVTEV